MAVDFPVPVVPISLKCLVSSAASRTKPPNLSDSGSQWVAALRGGAVDQLRPAAQFREQRCDKGVVLPDPEADQAD
jgi:hypothetical protein